MKLTHKRLKQFIKEELNYMVSEIETQQTPSQKILASADERRIMLQQLSELRDKQVEIYKLAEKFVKSNPDETIKLLNQAKLLDQQIKSINTELNRQYDEYFSSNRK